MDRESLGFIYDEDFNGVPTVFENKDTKSVASVNMSSLVQINNNNIVNYYVYFEIDNVILSKLSEFKIFCEGLNIGTKSSMKMVKMSMRY